MPPGELAANPFGEAPAAKAPTPSHGPQPTPPAVAEAPRSHGGDTVHFFDEYGTLREADASQLPAIVAGNGRIATPEEVRKAELDAKYGGLGGTLAAGAEGAARGLTVGLADPLAVGAGRLIGGERGEEAVRQHLAEEQEAHPYLSTGAELAGAIAPVLLSGGTAAGAEGAARGGAAALGEATEAGVMAKIGQGIRAIGGPAESVSYLGGAAERAAAGMLGDTAGSVLGRAAQGAAKTAVRGIVEGGLFGAGQEISEDTLKDVPLTAEKLFTAVGHGALMGGLLGGAAGGAGSLLGDAASSALGGGAGAKLSDAASDQAFGSLDAKGANEAAIKRAGGRTEIGRTYLDEVLRPAVEEKGITGAALSNDEKLALTNQVLDRVSTEATEKLAGSEAQIKLSDVLKPFDERIEEFSGKLGQTNIAGRMTQLREEAAAILGKGEAGPDTMVSVGDLYRQKQSLQKAAYQAARTMNPSEPVQQLREVSGAFNSIIEDAMNKAGAAAGDGAVGTELRALNKKMQRLMVVQDILEHNSVRYARNDTLSLTSKMFGASEIAGSLAAGHPLGALGAIPAMAATEAVKHHGNAYAALMLDRLANFGGASRAVAEFDQGVDKAIDSALTGKALAKASAPSTSEARFEAEEQRIRQLAAMAPGIVGAHLQQRTAPLATHMPQVAQAMQQQAKAMTAYLATKLPPDPTTAGDSLTPQLASAPVSAPDRAKLLRAIDATEGGPPAIMKRLARGTMTTEDVEVLKRFFPHSYDELREKVAAKCADRKTPVPYQTRIRLGTLFELPTDPTLRPAFMLSVQQSYAHHDNAQTAGPAPKRSAPATLSVSKEIASEFDSARGGA